MPICTHCNQDVCKPCAIRPGFIKPNIIQVAADHELMRESHFRRLAIATRALNLSRREIPNWMADTIYSFHGRIIWHGGKLFELEDIDSAFNDDGSFRWLSDFMNFAGRPPLQKPQWRVLKRLRLIDLAFRIQSARRAGLISL